jgi:hypothetical protein
MMFILCGEPLGMFDSAPGHQERQEGQTGGKILPAHANRRVKK